MPGRLSRIIGTAVFICGAFLAKAEDDSAYRLFARDVIKMVVFGEPDMAIQLRISGIGTINAPLIGDIKIAGLTLAEAQSQLEKAYVDAEIFIRPQITLQVAEYSKKEISILGQIGRQGKIELPVESVRINIVNAVSLAGGFTRIARADAVRVTRKLFAEEEEQVFTVNVEQMIAGKSKEPPFYIYPGDVIFVPERLF